MLYFGFICKATIKYVGGCSRRADRGCLQAQNAAEQAVYWELEPGISSSDKPRERKKVVAGLKEDWEGGQGSAEGDSRVLDPSWPQAEQTDLWWWGGVWLGSLEHHGCSIDIIWGMELVCFDKHIPMATFIPYLLWLGHPSCIVWLVLPLLNGHVLWCNE